MKIDEHEQQRICEIQGEDGQLFNLEALRKEYSPVFIVQDRAVVKMLAAAGYEAVGLEDPANAEEVRNALERSKTRPGLVISLPWADGFTDAADRIKSKADELHTPAVIMDAENGEYIGIDTADRLEALAQKGIAALTGSFTRKNNVAETFTEFCAEIQDATKYKALKTGLPSFDALIGGGLYPGLYTIGAEPAAGKTAFVMQIADHIAKGGKAVFVYAVEMSRNELKARSISRLTFEKSRNPGQALREKLKKAGIRPEKLAKTARDILDGSRHAYFSDLENEVMTDCVREYHFPANGSALPLFVIESFEGTTANNIREEVDLWQRTHGSAPVVIVDYLQILAPINDRGTDKQNADAAVKVLKSIARTYKTPVIVISSLNRSSYDDDTGAPGWKETGGIEYTADITIRLTIPEILEAGEALDANGKKLSKEAVARAKRDKRREIMGKDGKRTVGALIEKSRFGLPYQTANFDFYGAYSCFIPQEGAFQEISQDAELPFSPEQMGAEQQSIFGKVTPPGKPKGRL